MAQESISKGVIKYSISTWANLVVGFISVIFTTRLLSPESYGIIAIFLSASTVIMYIVTMGLDGAMLRFYNEPPAGDTKEQLMYKVIVISTAICLFSGVLTTLLVGGWVSNYIFGFVSKTLVGLLFLHTLVNVIMRYLNISFRMAFKARQYTIQNILINCLSRVLTIIAALFTDDVYYIISVFVIGLAVVLLVYLISQRQEFIPVGKNGVIDKRLSFMGYKEYFRFALFSAPTYIVTYLNIYLGQHIIQNNLGAYELGIYSSAGMFVTILAALQGGFGTYWSAYVYKNYNEDSSRIKMMHDYAMVFIILVVSSIVIGRDAIYLFIGKDFHSSKQFFSLLLLAPSLSFLMQTTAKGIEIAKKNQISLIAHIIAVIVNVVLCIYFTKVWGLIGAAFANALSGVFLYVMSTIYGQKYYKTIDNSFKSIVGTLLLIAVVLSAFVFNDIISIIIMVIIIDVISYIVYKKEFNILVINVIPNLLKSFFRK